MNTINTPYKTMHDLLDVFKSNSHSIIGTIVVDMLTLFTVALPKWFSISLIYLSIGHYADDIKAIAGICAIVVSVFTLVNLLLSIVEKVNKNDKKN